MKDTNVTIYYKNTIYMELEKTLIKTGSIKNVPIKYNRLKKERAVFTHLRFYNLVDFLRKQGHEIGYEITKPFNQSYIFLLNKK